MNLILKTVIPCAFLLLAACGTTDSSLRDQGHSESYVQGFHDGRHSGMSEEGNAWEHWIRDESLFKADEEYRSGWLAGESEGKRLQDEAVAAGNIAAGAYSADRIGKEVDKQTDYDAIARDAVKDVDSNELKSLEK